MYDVIIALPVLIIKNRDQLSKQPHSTEHGQIFERTFSKLTVSFQFT